MKKIINNIEIECEKEAENYIDEVIKHLISQTDKIYTFFDFVPEKPLKIKIVKNIEELKKIYKNKVSQ